MTANKKPSVDPAAQAADSEQFVQDMLRIADDIESLTRKFSEDVQRLLIAQAALIRSKAISRHITASGADGDKVVILED